MNVEDLLHTIVSNPHEVWPQETYFHQRNREKIERSIHSWKKRIPGLSTKDFIYIFSKLFHEYSGSIIYIMSRGGSGCHYACEILEDCNLFSSAHAEVYLPVEYVQTLPWADESVEALLNLVEILHIPDFNGARGILNIGHMSSVNRPSVLRQVRKKAKFILLKRHPHDIVVSRALRKPEYKARAHPNVKSIDYFEQQAKTLKVFITRSSKEKWDAEISYEDLIADPLQSFSRAFESIDLPYRIDFCSNGLQQSYKNKMNDASWSNRNTSPKPALNNDHKEILKKYLDDDVLRLWGYQLERPFD